MLALLHLEGLTQCISEHFNLKSGFYQKLNTMQVHSFYILVIINKKCLRTKLHFFLFLNLVLCWRSMQVLFLEFSLLLYMEGKLIYGKRQVVDILCN